MILFKNNADTLGQVIANAKHASNSRPTKAKYGDIILIAQTKRTLKDKEKSIRYMMYYDGFYEDFNNESKDLWGKSWKYIIKGYDVRPIEPFNIEDIQVSNHNYSSVMTHCSLLEEDKEAVLNWIFAEETTMDNRTDIYEIEFNKLLLNEHKLLKEIDAKFANAPDYKERITTYLHRPSCIRNAIIRIKGTRCQICGYEGFHKKNSNENYCEVHHMIDISAQIVLEFSALSFRKMVYETYL